MLRIVLLALCALCLFCVGFLSARWAPRSWLGVLIGGLFCAVCYAFLHFHR